MAIEKYDPDQENKPLWNDILEFSKHKILLAVVLILIGLTGFIVPIIPGILLIVLAVALLRKGTMSKIRSRLRGKS